jgi:hypothetical protein
VTSTTRCARCLPCTSHNRACVHCPARVHVKDGQIVYGGPDHYARLAATKHFRDFLMAGRPAPKAPEKQERRLVTLQEFEELVRSSEVENRVSRIKLIDRTDLNRPFLLRAHFRFSYARESYSEPSASARPFHLRACLAPPVRARTSTTEKTEQL